MRWEYSRLYQEQRKSDNPNTTSLFLHIQGAFLHGGLGLRIRIHFSCMSPGADRGWRPVQSAACTAKMATRPA